jgi:tRNA nucleotidyltransferase/poly(A) polymerase
VLSSERPRGVLLRLAALWHDLGKPETRTVEEDGRVHFFGHPELGSEQVGDLARHLRFSNDEVEYFQTVVAGHLRPLLLADEGHPTKRAAYHLFRDAGIDGLDVLTLATADQRATYGDEPDPERVVRLQNLQSKFLAWFFDSRANLLPAPLVNGHDLMAMFDLAPGRGIGDLLDAIREAQVEGRVKTREDAFALAKNLLDRPVRSPKT